jgi:DNA polymerase III epsilon subunit-like protein
MKKLFNHVMIDLETLSTKSNATICSIGAIEFDIETGEIGRQFHEKVQIQSCLDLGCHIDGLTIEWWLKQSDKARTELVREAKPVGQVLFKLSHWMSELAPDFGVWANGKGFDLPILISAFERVGQRPPWNYWQERDVRTLAMLSPIPKEKRVFKGEKHDALDDCKNQIDLVSSVYQHIKKVAI